MRSICCICLVLSAGCAGPAVIYPAPAPSGTAVLLLTTPDGEVIQQDVAADGDVCVRSIPLDLMSCYSKGEPLRDPETDAVVGYEMERTDIKLPAR